MLMTIILIQHCGKLQGEDNEGISNRIGGWTNNASLLGTGSIHGFRFVERVGGYYVFRKWIT